MAYATGNPKTKKELKERLAAGRTIEVFSPGPFPCTMNGEVTLESPHYPAPHKWYARAIVANGRLVKVLP